MTNEHDNNEHSKDSELNQPDNNNEDTTISELKNMIQLAENAAIYIEKRRQAVIDNFQVSEKEFKLISTEIQYNKLIRLLENELKLADPQVRLLLYKLFLLGAAREESPLGLVASVVDSKGQTKQLTKGRLGLYNKFSGKRSLLDIAEFQAVRITFVAIVNGLTGDLGLELCELASKKGLRPTKKQRACFSSFNRYDDFWRRRPETAIAGDLLDEYYLAPFCARERKWKKNDDKNQEQ